MKLDRIIIGIDGSANSAAALAWATGFAAHIDAEIVAVHAVGLLERLDHDMPVPAQPHRDEITERFEDVWCAPLEWSAVRSRRLVRDGPPVLVLLAIAEEEDADMIVVGSRGVGEHPELLLGSTSTQVAQHATRPVVIIPAATSER